MMDIYCMSVTHGNQEVTDEKILSAIENSPDPVSSTAEIAETVGLTRHGVNDRLQDLKEDGAVENKDVGTGYVWWVSN